MEGVCGTHGLTAICQSPGAFLSVRMSAWCTDWWAYVPFLPTCKVSTAVVIVNLSFVPAAVTQEGI